MSRAYPEILYFFQLPCNGFNVQGALGAASGPFDLHNVPGLVARLRKPLGLTELLVFIGSGDVDSFFLSSTPNLSAFLQSQYLSLKIQPERTRRFPQTSYPHPLSQCCGLNDTSQARRQGGTSAFRAAAEVADVPPDHALGSEAQRCAFCFCSKRCWPASRLSCLFVMDKDRCNLGFFSSPNSRSSSPGFPYNFLFVWMQQNHKTPAMVGWRLKARSAVFKK